MGSIIAAAKELAERIAAGGIKATHDPTRAAVLRPCVLVAPPSIDYTTRANVWPLVCLSGQRHGSLQALTELDQLLQALGAVAGVHPEDATPAVYTLSTDLPAVPAYIVTITT